MNNCFGSCLTLIKRQERKQSSKTESSSQTHFGSGGGTATQHIIHIPPIRPNVQAPAQSGKPPAIPGADFANNIATSVEKTSNNIVVNVEKFANSIVPPPPKALT